MNLGKEKRRAPNERMIDDATREAAYDELVRLLIRGTSYAQCAELLGFHVNTIKKWIKKPEFDLKLRRTRALVYSETDVIPDKVAQQVMESVEKLIERGAEKAIVKITTLMEQSKNEHIQLKAAVDLADRDQRTSKTKKVQQINLNAFLTPELLVAAAAAARTLSGDTSGAMPRLIEEASDMSDVGVVVLED